MEGEAVARSHSVYESGGCMFYNNVNPDGMKHGCVVQVVPLDRLMYTPVWGRTLKCLPSENGFFS